MAFKFKILLIPFLLLFPISGITQNSSQNTFSIKLNVPVIIDEELKTEYVPEKMQDKYQEFRDKKSSVSFGVNNCPLKYANNQISGTWTNEYFPNDKIAIRGIVSDDYMTLESITVEYNLKLKDDYHNESKSVLLNFENVPMYNGNCLFDKSKSKLELLKYEYSKTEINKEYYTYTHKITGKSIDFDEIPKEPKLATWKFRIQLKIDGPPSFTINTENIRGIDPDWKPPLFSNSDKDIPFEPGSIGIYENCPTWITAGSVNTVSYSFLKDKKYKILERTKIEKINDEIELSKFGLVGDDTKISDHLFKEQIALIVDYKAENKTFECIVASVNGQRKVTAFPVTEDNYGFLITEFCAYVDKAVNELLITPEK